MAEAVVALGADPTSAVEFGSSVTPVGDGGMQLGAAGKPASEGTLESERRTTDSVAAAGTSVSVAGDVISPMSIGSDAPETPAAEPEEKKSENMDDETSKTATSKTATLSKITEIFVTRESADTKGNSETSPSIPSSISAGVVDLLNVAPMSSSASISASGSSVVAAAVDAALSTSDGSVDAPSETSTTGPFSVSLSRKISDATTAEIPVHLLTPTAKLDLIKKSAETRVKHTDDLIEIFNLDHDKGWAAIQESKLVIVDDPEEVARLFYESYGVNPVTLGKWLGKGKHAKFLDEFVKLNDFRGLSIADAVRHMLRRFKPEGENAIIDRMITSFAFAYKRDNPDCFSLPDTAYQLAFAALMLNTALHNPQAFKKAPEMCKSPSAFRRVVTKDLCRGEERITKSLILDLYSSIASRPIELVHDKYLNIFRDSVRSGWMEKKCEGRVTSWKRRLFVLSGHAHIGFAIYYFKGGADRAWRVMIPLNENVVCEALPKDPITFRLRHMKRGLVTAAKRSEDGTVVKNTREDFVFRCKDARQSEFWMAAINSCVTDTLEERSRVSKSKNSWVRRKHAKSHTSATGSREDDIAEEPETELADDAVAVASTLKLDEEGSKSKGSSRAALSPVFESKGESKADR